MVSFQTKVAIGILLTSGIALGGLIYLISLDENDWIRINQHTHPPTVEIAREGPDVWIRWYGGWDESFIDHMQICTQPGSCIVYPKPEPGGYIIIQASEESQIIVSGWDVAGHYYHPIANVTI
jgi:hypothetical protein